MIIIDDNLESILFDELSNVDLWIDYLIALNEIHNGLFVRDGKLPYILIGFED
jgi:hypothetical protein